MKKVVYVLCFAIIFALSTIAFSSDFKAYPGAKLDAKASEKVTKVNQEMAKASEMTGAKATIYTTNDPFEKVHAFYKGIAKEYKMPGERGVKKLPSGQ